MPITIFIYNNVHYRAHLAVGMSLAVRKRFVHNRVANRWLTVLTCGFDTTYNHTFTSASSSSRPITLTVGSGRDEGKVSYHTFSDVIEEECPYLVGFANFHDTDVICLKRDEDFDIFPYKCWSSIAHYLQSGELEEYDNSLCDLAIAADYLRAENFLHTLIRHYLEGRTHGKRTDTELLNLFQYLVTSGHSTLCDVLAPKICDLVMTSYESVSFDLLECIFLRKNKYCLKESTYIDTVLHWWRVTSHTVPNDIVKIIRLIASIPHEKSHNVITHLLKESIPMACSDALNDVGTKLNVTRDKLNDTLMKAFANEIIEKNKVPICKVTTAAVNIQHSSVYMLDNITQGLKMWNLASLFQFTHGDRGRLYDVLVENDTIFMVSCHERMLTRVSKLHLTSLGNWKMRETVPWEVIVNVNHKVDIPIQRVVNDFSHITKYRHYIFFTIGRLLAVTSTRRTCSPYFDLVSVGKTGNPGSTVHMDPEPGVLCVTPHNNKDETRMILYSIMSATQRYLYFYDLEIIHPQNKHFLVSAKGGGDNRQLPYPPLKDGNYYPSLFYIPAIQRLVCVEPIHRNDTTPFILNCYSYDDAKRGWDHIFLEMDKECVPAVQVPLLNHFPTNYAYTPMRGEVLPSGDVIRLHGCDTSNPLSKFFKSYCVIVNLSLNTVTLMKLSIAGVADGFATWRSDGRETDF